MRSVQQLGPAPQPPPLSPRVVSTRSPMLSEGGEAILDTRCQRPCSWGHILTHPPSVFPPKQPKKQQQQLLRRPPAPPPVLRRAAFRRLSHFCSYSLVSPDAPSPPPPTCLLPPFPLHPRRRRLRRGESTCFTAPATLRSTLPPQPQPHDNAKSSPSFPPSPTPSSPLRDPDTFPGAHLRRSSTSSKKHCADRTRSRQTLKKRTRRCPR